MDVFALRESLSATIAGMPRASSRSAMKSYEVAEYGEFRQRRMILERFDAMAEAEASGLIYDSVLAPPLADPCVAHEARLA